MKQIIVNSFSKITGRKSAAIVMNINNFKNENDAMNYAKFKVSRISEKDYRVTIITI